MKETYDRVGGRVDVTYIIYIVGRVTVKFLLAHSVISASLAGELLSNIT